MQSHILLIAPTLPPATFIRALNHKLNLACTHAASFQHAVEHMQRKEFTILLIDSDLASTGPFASDALFTRAGMAQVLELDFRRLNESRALTEVRAAINRGVHYQWRAYEQARERLVVEFHSNISVLLDESEDVLRSIGRSDAPKIRRIARLAGNLRSQLGAESS